MTVEEELAKLRDENQQLRRSIREHRTIGEAAESEVRRLKLERQRLETVVQKLIEIRKRARCIRWRLPSSYIASPRTVRNSPTRPCVTASRKVWATS